MRKKSRRDTQIAAALEVVYRITNGRPYDHSATNSDDDGDGDNSGSERSNENRWR
jgi:hypothetical protein